MMAGAGSRRSPRGAGGAGPTIESLIDEAKRQGPRPVYLLSGDEFLVSQAVESLVDALVPASSRDLNLSLLDGAATDAATISRDLAQAPMFRGTKLVVVRETTLLTGKADLEAEVARARQLYDDGRHRDAARRMLAVIGKARWEIADLTESSMSRWGKDLGVSSDSLDPTFLRAVREIAEKEELRVPAADTAALEKMLGGGAPPGNALVLTCKKPDRRLALTKLVEKLGVHLVCEAARTGRQVEDLDIGAVKKAVLGRYGKKLDREAEKALIRAAGSELRLLASELEKLCLFTGDDKVIGLDDVWAVGVRQVREEAFWELGNAVCGKSLSEALWYVHDAFEHNRHAIQILSGIVTALRKALQVRSVAERHGVYRGGRDLPAAVVEEVGALRGRKPHPYALRMEFERSLAWPSVQDLALGLQACREADRLLKTSRGSPRLVVERLVMRLCGEPASNAPGPSGRSVGARR